MKIHDREIGIGKPAYIVAEIGINHNGDTALARAMIDAAKAAGCDAVKFQNYKTEQFIGQRSEFWTYENHGEKITERQYDMFKRCEVDKGKLQWLKNHADRVGIHMHSTPMCKDGLRDCVDLGFGVLKNGSDCLRDLELLTAMFNTGLPVVVSTGMAKVQEIQAAYFCAKEWCGSQLEDRALFLHCTSAYPCPDKDVNIRRVSSLRSLALGCMTGFSDHSVGATAAVLSVAYGAVWIEKHFTLDKGLPGPDHAFSADPREMAQLVQQVRQAEQQKGDTILGMTDLEAANRAEWFK